MKKIIFYNFLLYTFILNHIDFITVQVIRAREAFKLAVEQLDSMIDFYRKRLGMKNLEFISISGTTHLIEVV